ncbi:MAG: monomeric [FeFe] hydrogenase [Bacteroidota bacterium]|nr:monomeric [FeFe] hydrogenase [Bacteroidota bacterium]
MPFTNNAVLIRREFLTKICQLLDKDLLIEKIDRIPLEMRPRNSDYVRCCVHKDRAVLKYKIMASLGYNRQDEEDELTPLSGYAQQALSRKSSTDVMLTVVDEACSSCRKNNYIVTNICQGCVGRKCIVNCPKNAIDFINGKAKINQVDCVNCGICMENCPFHAIVFMPVPCEEACPVNAISKNSEGIEQIDFDKCILCGKCLEACPYGAILEKSNLLEIYSAIKSDAKTIAMVAPAIAGQFRVEMSKILSGFKALGFDEVVEVAQGADVTIKHEAEEFVEKMEQQQSLMTTSCCTSYRYLVDKHIPELQQYVSDTKTPLQYTAQIVRAQNPDAKLVFVGPCIAKRKEVFDNDNIDYMLNFEEFGAMLIAKKIDVNVCDSIDLDNDITKEARGFAVSGGVANAVKSVIPSSIDFKPVLINGVDKKEFRELKKISKGKGEGNFVEVMMCKDGCVGGCNTIAKSKTAKRQIGKMATETKIEVD